MKLLAHSFFLPTEPALSDLVLPASLKRRAPRIWKIAYAAAKQVIDQTSVKPDSIIVGTALGALDETVQFIDKVHLSNMGSPRQFISSVHNSMSGMLAMEFGITGTNLTLCESSNSAASAIFTAHYTPDSTVLVVIIDEHFDLLSKVYAHCSQRDLFVNGPLEGALALLLSRESGFPQIIATPASPVGESPIKSGSFFAAASELAAVLIGEQSTQINSYSPTTKCSATISVQYE